MKKLFIIGSGGFSKQVLEIIEEINEDSNEYELVGLIDDNIDKVGHNLLGYEVVGTTDYLREYSKKHKVYGVVAIADADIRRQIVRKLKLVEWVNLIHPQAIVSKYINLGVGNVICAGVVINPDCYIGNHCHINIGTTLGHDITIMDFVTVMPGANISGNVLLKSFSTVGTGSIIIQGLIIEEHVFLAAGSTVIKNSLKNSLYAGVPAKKVKDISIELSEQFD
ncbi:acetyltransferase [Bacillus sp. SD088]|uniref:acetyltransferase n=1 Tax=Bacillus sp. SD088 TaxID=2782012 RepID=UPI001A9681A0|nr:acetyltransferase [Bacillus sp. SD088]MBO0991445.1 acetyltransferase [Bacillus sp. SD088]